MFSVFFSIVRRDLLLAARSPGERLAPSLFFVAATAVFPLGASPNPEVLRQSAPAVIWVAALLAALLSQDSLFRDDRDDGALEQALLAPQPLALFVLAKSAAHFHHGWRAAARAFPGFGGDAGAFPPRRGCFGVYDDSGRRGFQLVRRVFGRVDAGNSARGDAAGAAGLAVLRAGAHFRRRGCFRR